MHTDKPKFQPLSTFGSSVRLFAGIETLVDTPPAEKPVVVPWDISGNGHLQKCASNCIHLHCPKCGDKVARDSLSIYCEKDRGTWDGYQDRP